MKKLVVIIVICSAFFSCEKEIDVDVKEGDQKWVIEAKVSDQANQTEVKITKSLSISSVMANPVFTNAMVSIEDLSTSQTYVLTPNALGVYKNMNLVGTPLHTYRLEIRLEGNRYISESTMPKKVEFLGVSQPEPIDYEDDETTSNTKILPQYTDPVDAENHYQFLVKRNQEPVKELFVQSDRYFNGLPNTRHLRFYAKKTEQIEVEMQCIGKPEYEYLFGLLQNSNPTATTPSNPTSNISNGAVGYFKAYTSSVKNIVLN